jgi:hypothetical protein
MPGRPHPPNRHARSPLAASASAAEVESHLSYKLLLVTGLLVGSAAWFAASLTGSGRQAEPPLRLPLAVPLAKMPAASQPAWQKDPSLPVPLLDLGRQDPAAEHAEPAAVAAAPPVAAEAWASGAEPSTASAEEDTWTTVHVESGDNLWTLFTPLGDQQSGPPRHPEAVWGALAPGEHPSERAVETPCGPPGDLAGSHLPL